jgi:RHS repeat-associated protein
LGLFAEVRQNRVGVIFYGDEITSTANDREKFGTYTRDSYTGLDYARQRYFASTYGRFTTPDPAAASIHPSNPGTWDRYVYVNDDPINLNDPNGLAPCPSNASWSTCFSNLLQIGNGAVQVGAAGLGFTALLGFDAVSDGLATGLVVAGAPALLGQAAGGVLSIYAGWSGNQTVGDLGSKISTLTNPIGALATAILPTKPDAASMTSDAGSALLSGASIGVSVLSGKSPSLGDIAGIISAVVNTGTGYAVSLITSPVEVSSSSASVPYDPSPVTMPAVLVAGGGNTDRNFDVEGELDDN